MREELDAATFLTLSFCERPDFSSELALASFFLP